MKKTILTLIAVTVLFVPSVYGQDVATEFAQLQEAIEQSTASPDLKSSMTTWATIAEVNLTDGTETGQ